MPMEQGPGRVHIPAGAHHAPMLHPLLVIALLLAPSSALADGEGVPSWLAGELSLSTGVDYTQGHYGDDERTEILYVPVTFAYLFDELALTPYPNDLFELKVTLPWVSVEGPTVPDGQGQVSDGGPNANDQRHGLGDIVVGASYLLFPPADSRLPALELSGRVKTPSADEGKGLGTGEPSYTVQVDLYRRFGAITPLVTAGYRISDASREVAFTSVGASVRVAEELSGGLLYDWSQGAVSDQGHVHELFPYLTIRTGEHVRVTPYSVIGLSPDAADWGVGLQLKLSVPVR